MKVRLLLSFNISASMRILAVTLFTLISVSCSLQNRYIVVGECDTTLDSDTVILAYSNGGTKLCKISECEVRDGKFRFEGYVHECRLCYIYNTSSPQPVITQVFIEGGCTSVRLTRKRNVHNE